MGNKYIRIVLFILFLILIDQIFKIGFLQDGLQLIPRATKNFICNKYGSCV